MLNSVRDLVPWLGLLAVALVAPWLLGGRAANALFVLGTMSWIAVGLSLMVVWLQYWSYRPFAGYDRERGVTGQHPLLEFGKGLLWSLPMLVLVAGIGYSVRNPMYAWGELDGRRVLLLQEFQQHLPVVVDVARSGPAVYFLTGLWLLAVIACNRRFELPRVALRTGAVVLLLNAAVLTGVGFWFELNGSKLLLGHFPARAHYFFSTFYYKNHWAVFGILNAALATGFFFRDLPRWLHEGRRAGGGVIALLLVLFIGISLPVAESRSGTLLFVILSLLLLGKVCFAVPSRGIRVMALLAAVAAVGGAFFFSKAELDEGWRRTQQQVDRAGSWNFDRIRTEIGPQTCRELLRIRPWLGWGYYSFSSIFPAFAPDQFRRRDGSLRMHMEFAHTDWWQFTAEFGIIGMLLLWVTIVGALVRAGLGKLWRAPLERWILIGCALVLVQAVYEFPLSNPAVMVLFTLLISAVIGVARPGEARKRLHGQLRGA